MPLLPATLVQGFSALITSKPSDRAAVARRWAEIYDSYAQAGVTANGGKPIFTGAERRKLEAVLLAALLVPVGVPPALAAAWGTGLAAYWGGPPVLTTPGAIPVAPFTVPGVSAPPLGVPALVAGLTVLYATPVNQDRAFAVAQASLLDVCTRTVLVTFAPGGAFPVV